ncbi:hypothetical protein [Streptomyces sp. NPDC088736]|uniref:hypothetical protein n=1 Tax=Streptomyces sp. NPDC088736 TaxID=3365881 RepID=UPI00380D7E81
MTSNPTPDRATITRNLEALIEKQGNPEPYLEDECGYLDGLKDALRIVNGEPPANDRSET